MQKGAALLLLSFVPFVIGGHKKESFDKFAGHVEAFEGCGTPTTFWNASLETLIGETRHIFGLATAMVQFTLVVPFKERAHVLCKQRCCAHLQYILT